jgi:hypothetical protein
VGGGSERSSGGGGASKAECEKLVAGRSRVAGISLLTRTRTRVTCTREPVRVAKPVQIPRCQTYPPSEIQVTLYV